MAFDLDAYLRQAEERIHPSTHQVLNSPNLPPDGKWHVGVDLGTAYLVMVILNEDNQVLAGEYQFAEVVRDGLVVDYIGAVDLLRGMKARLEERLGKSLSHAATGYPPGVPLAEVSATRHVIEAAGMDCSSVIDEPSAANLLLQVKNGVVVDVGGGTTGVAVLRNGKVIYTADEATGGTHFSLVIAGALNLSFEEAERIKKDAQQQERLFPIVRPVMEKVGSIIARHIAGFNVDSITLVGGTACFPGMANVIEEMLQMPVHVPQRPLFVTPIGIAMRDGMEG